MSYMQITECRLTIGEKWCNSFLVTYPVSYRYNGGIVVDGKWYEGFEVVKPNVPAGFTLESIGCGLQLNARPPYATAYLKPIHGEKITRKMLRSILAAYQGEEHGSDSNES